MKRRTFLSTLATACAVSTLPGTLLADGTKKKLLYFDRSTSFVHPSTKIQEDGLSFGSRVLKKLAEKLGYELVCTKDGRVFDGDLEAYDAFLFNCCGQLTGEKGEPGSFPMSKEGEQKFFAAIRAGKGLLGFHSASDTNHSGGPAFENKPEAERSEYIRILGGEFIVHGSQQAVTLRFPNPKDLPSLAALGESWDAPVEEWYALKNFNPDIHVLIVQDTEGMKIEGGNKCYNRPPYPCTWVRKEGQGTVAFTTFAHNQAMWEADWVQAILLDLMKVITGKLECDFTPNLNQAAPGGTTLQN
ncbi:MAG: ThuA domain-containing protein [Planctomycetia bacterium]|nr:ThuA domain-containing protein [Planctomycetia bacterium]